MVLTVRVIPASEVLNDCRVLLLSFLYKSVLNSRFSNSLVLFLAGRLDRPFSGPLGLWKDASVGELVRRSPIREYVMVLVTNKRIRYVSDEDPTLAKVSSDLQH